jgi:hypothetical protein
VKRFPLMVASGAIGLALLVGVTHKLTASTETGTPPSDGYCYYHLWNCSYDGTGYWDGCDPNYAEGWIPTSYARAICTTYHDR